MRHLSDAAAQVTLAQSYGPFGGLTEQTGSGTSGFGYTGEQEDASTGLVFLRARYYDPSVGVFVSKDPFPGHLLRPQTQNSYVYVTNNPIRFTDPMGYDGGDPEISPFEQFLIDLTDFFTFYEICLGSLGCSGGPEHQEWNAENNLPYLEENTQWMIQNPWQAAGHGHIEDLSNAIAKSQFTQDDDGLIIGFSGVSASTVASLNLFNINDLEPLKFNNECLGANGVTDGIEIVYDFKHQERGIFSYSGNVFNALSAYNGGVSYYFGKSRGFANPANTYDLGVEAYSGRSASISYNLDTPIEFIGGSKIEAAGLYPDGTINENGIFATYYGISVGWGISSPVNVDITVANYSLLHRERYVLGMANSSDQTIAARKKNVAYRIGMAARMSQEIMLLRNEN